MKRLFALPLVALTFVAAVRADPYVGYVYPAAVRAGTTNVVVVGGQAFWGSLRNAGVSGEGVHVLDVKMVPGFPQPIGGQRAYLNKWLDAIDAGVTNAPALTNDPYRVDWHSNVWYQALNTLTDLERNFVSRFLNVPRNPLQMAPSLRQNLLVTVAVDADAPLGRRDFNVWSDQGMSAPHPFFVDAAPHVPEPLYRPPHRLKPRPPTVLALPCTLDGQILPGETDSFTFVLEKGRRFTCAVVGRALEPYVGDAVPGWFNPSVRLLDEAGREIGFADDNGSDPDPVLSCNVPETGFYTLEIRDVLFRGREDFVYFATCSYGAEETAEENATPDPMRFTLPASGEGRRHRIDVAAPGVKTIAVSARAEGSPADLVLTLYDDDDALLATCDDVVRTLFVGIVPQRECDPSFAFRFPKAGTYWLDVVDAQRRGGAACFYDLCVEDARPDFAVYAAKSSFCQRPWGSAALPVHVERLGGFDGPITLVAADNLLRIDNATIPAGTNFWKASVVNLSKVQTDVRESRIFALADFAGEPVVRPVVPCDTADQAFAWTHLVPACAFRFKSLPPWPQKKKPAAKAVPPAMRKPAKKKN